MAERFSSLVGRVFDVVENEDGLHPCGATKREWGLQPSLVRIFQVLRVATTRSPRQRIRAWALCTAFRQCDSFGR